MKSLFLITVAIALSACSNQAAAPVEAASAQPMPQASSQSPPDAAPPAEAAPPKVEPVLDVPSIAGKTQADVEKLIGKPTSCESTKHGPKCLYAKGEAEIVFIQGKADWITVEALDSAPFEASTIALVGLPAASPSFQNNNVIRWEGMDGLLTAQLSPGAAGKADYAYIKVRTP